MSGVVVDGTDDHAARPGHGRAQRLTLQVAGLVALLEVLHFAGVSGGDPFGKMAQLGELCDRSDAGQLKAGVVRCLFDERRHFAEQFQSGDSEAANFIIAAITPMRFGPLLSARRRKQNATHRRAPPELTWRSGAWLFHGKSPTERDPD